MRVFDQTHQYIICHRSDEKYLSEQMSHGILRTRRIAIAVMTGSRQSLFKRVRRLNDLNVLQILDRFNLVLHGNNLVLRQQVLDDFFDAVASEYDSMIDLERNVSNIENLLGLLEGVVGPVRNKWVLDYGCGTGLSAIVAQAYGVNLIGFDRSAKMRKIASNRGMQVWSMSDCARHEDVVLDGIFSSYVLHLYPDIHNLSLIWKRLRPGGAFVANFHKNKGIEVVNALAKNLGCVPKRVEVQKAADFHGAYMIYVKK